MERKYAPPEPTTNDAAAAVTRAAVQLIPGVGSSAVELLNLAIAGPLERRRGDWMRRIAEGLEAAEVRIEDLGERQDEVLDTLLQASAAALRTSNDEKRTALRNAVINAATKNDPDADERHLFVQLVDRFTPSHLRVLKAFQDPLRWAQEHDVKYSPAMMSGLDHFLEEAFPELRGRRDFYDAVWSDLWQAGLVNTDGLHATMSERGWQAPRISELGKRFVRLIEA